MAHAQMLCHPETKSKVRPNEKYAMPAVPLLLPLLREYLTMHQDVIPLVHVKVLIHRLQWKNKHMNIFHWLIVYH